MKRTNPPHWLFAIIIILFAAFGYLITHIISFSVSPEKEKSQVTTEENTSSVVEKPSFELPKKCYKDPKVAIYMYHYVRPDAENTPDSTPYKLSIVPEEFAKQMHYLGSLQAEGKVSIIFFSELEQYEKAKCFPNEKIVLLTSDDGWDDTFRHILPVVEKERLKFHTALIVNRIGTDTKRVDTFMTQTEVKKVLASPYFEALSHTYTHPELPKDTEDELRHELCDSKKYLEKTFGVTINTVVYPVGHDNEKVEQEAKKCGYHYGLAIKNKTFIMDGTQNNLELARLRMDRGQKDSEIIFRALGK